MTLRRLFTILACTCTAISFLELAGCADLKEQLPAPVSSGVQVHDVSWTDTAAANFHGRVLKARQYDFIDCSPCHAQSFAGGISGISCFSCHTSFPHGMGWSDTAAAMFHGRILSGQQWETAECARCHGTSFTGGTSGVSCFTCHDSFPHPPGWIDTLATVFHGNFIRNAGWDMRSCQACHGPIYAGGRVNVSCRTCHTGGAGPENCTTCHGGANAAPPRDLSRNTSRTAPGVGAHQIHVLGSSIASAIPCSECHTVPAAAYIPGHIDTTARAELTFGWVSRTVTNEPTTVQYDSTLPLFSPVPAYNIAGLTCSGAYCHGNFKNGNPSFAPVWNDVTATQAACGTCHGDVTRPTLAERALPMTSAQGGTHPNTTACATCHGDVVNANLQIISTSKHINGKLNVFGLEQDF